ncbi:HAD-IA family hydrolase [Rhabdothermincola sediminis]|uniref:HAD-IA family hydrolase n=1 Tax=Rhabdothermincola sediminis TaxID=2751370 RepID=UPI001AA073DC|nr:HAD-IA family hydrolase [Rhabdothermincola sediminis]
MIRAVLFDFGGVILSSPFDAFARYEAERGLPEGFIRRVNATNPDTNAWAQLERRKITLDEFCERFEAEAADAGHRLDAREVLALLGGELRPEMVEAVRRCSERLLTGLLTNNFVTVDGHVDREGEMGAVLALFDVVIESSKVGVRKPDPRFYELACRELGIEPGEAVFLDDLGVNLKPAREMGMSTIKVVDPHQALAQLEAVVGFPLR